MAFTSVKDPGRRVLGEGTLLSGAATISQRDR